MGLESINCNIKLTYAFAGPCGTFRLPTKRAARLGPSRPLQTRPHVSHLSEDVQVVHKERTPSITLKKRRKDYFFKLLSAARNRDQRLLMSVLRSLDEEDKDNVCLNVREDANGQTGLRLQDVLLKAASRCGQVALADRLLEVMLANGQVPTQQTAGAFLDALRAKEESDRCFTVFSELANKGVDLGCMSFNIVVSALVQDGNFTHAMDMVENASARWGIEPDTYTFNIIFGASTRHKTEGSKKAVRGAHELMMKWGVLPDRVTINAQINDAIKDGRLQQATDMFERALSGGFRDVVPDVITFNVGICAYMARQMDHKAFELLAEMDRRGVRPRADTFNTILSGLTKMGQTSRVMEVFNEFLRQSGGGNDHGVKPSVVTYNLVFRALALENDVGQARLVHADMRRRRIKPNDITLAALVRIQRTRSGVYDIMDTARDLRIRPSLTFLNSCMRALGDHNDALGACRVMDRIKALGNMDPDVISYNSLMYALVRGPWTSEVIGDGRDTGNPDDTKNLSQEAILFGSIPSHESCRQDAVVSGRSGDRGKGCAALFSGLTGVEAALFLLHEMRRLPEASRAAPDTITYTTVMSGVVRAEDAQRSQGRGNLWWHNLSGLRSGGVEDLAKGSEDFMSSTELCKHLFMDATRRGIAINGKICNAAMLGFGSDLKGAVRFWRQQIRPALASQCEQGAMSGHPKHSPTSMQSLPREDLLSAYSGLLHVCGRARRPDAAIKVVFALRKDGIIPSSVLSNTYFKAKQDVKDTQDNARAGFSIMQLLMGQMEDTLEAECGISKHAGKVDLPIERIRIRF